MKNTWLEFSLTLDLLALCIEAGLDFTSSLAEIARHNPKFNVLISSLRLRKTKELALCDFRTSWPDPRIEHFCQTLLYGWEQGISIAGLLKNMASHIRTQAYLDMEKDIQKKSLQLLLPLFLLILPSVILIIMTPLFIQLFSESF